MTEVLQELQYKGTIKELGAKEVSQAGKEKPRKVVISDSPTYQGKTFRVWANSPEWETLVGAANDGVDVEVGYTSEEKTFNGNTWTQNMIHWVMRQDSGFASGPPDDWGAGAPTPTSAAAAPAPQPTGNQTVTSNAPVYQKPDTLTLKDRTVTATAVVKWLVEGKHLTPESLDSGELKTLASKIVALVHEVAEGK